MSVFVPYRARSYVSLRMLIVSIPGTCYALGVAAVCSKEMDESSVYKRRRRRRRNAGQSHREKENERRRDGGEKNGRWDSTGRQAELRTRRTSQSVASNRNATAQSFRKYYRRKAA